MSGHAETQTGVGAHQVRKQRHRQTEEEQGRLRRTQRERESMHTLKCLERKKILWAVKEQTHKRGARHCETHESSDITHVTNTHAAPTPGARSRTQQEQGVLHNHTDRKREKETEGGREVREKERTEGCATHVHTSVMHE